MKNFILLLLSIMTIIMITGFLSCKTSKASTEKLLKFNLQKGNGYDYEIAWDTDQQMMGHANKINISGGFTLNVIEDKDKIKTLKCVYKDFKMYMKIMGMEINVDTDKTFEPINEEDNNENLPGMMDRLFSGIKGKEFTMKVNEEGKVIEVNGFEQIVNEMIDSIGLEGDIKLQMRASLKDQFNEQTIKDQFAQVFTIFPNKKIKVGDSWEKSFHMGGRMPAKYTTRYVVKDIEGDHVTLTAQTNIGSDNGEMEIKGTQSGTLLVDSKTGMVINAEFDQNIETKAQDMDIKIVGKGKMNGKAR